MLHLAATARVVRFEPVNFRDPPYPLKTDLIPWGRRNWVALAWHPQSAEPAWRANIVYAWHGRDLESALPDIRLGIPHSRHDILNAVPEELAAYLMRRTEHLAPPGYYRGLPRRH